MRKFSSQLWPMHYKPLPDELLSCWLVRLAHGHGLKAQTFCNAVFDGRQIWNRDIDRLAPTWLLNELSLRTGTSSAATFDTTLRSYEGTLYRKFRSAGSLQWILVLQMYHRKRNGYGLQFCPLCLAKDSIPFYRKRWRSALYTVCTLHQCMMLDRCPACNAAIAVHRLDMRTQDFDAPGFMSCCHACDFDLRAASSASPISYDAKATNLLLQASRVLESDHESSSWDIGWYSVMHHLCRTMTTRYKHVSLRHFVLDNLNIPDTCLTAGHTSFEMRSIGERHHLLQLSAWLLADLEPRLLAAWRMRAIRYNVLLKDFPQRPDWYEAIVTKFSNWRDIVE